MHGLGPPALVGRNSLGSKELLHLSPDTAIRGTVGNANPIGILKAGHDVDDHFPVAMRKRKYELELFVNNAQSPRLFEPAIEVRDLGAGSDLGKEVFANHILRRQMGEPRLERVVAKHRSPGIDLDHSKWKVVKLGFADR